MEFYRKKYEVFVDGEKYNTFSFTFFSNEPQEKESTISVDWNNIEEVAKKYGGILDFGYKKGRKFKKVLFHFRNNISSLRPLNMKIKVCVNKIERWSIKEILENKDGENAIIFLNEKGLNTFLQNF